MVFFKTEEVDVDTRYCVDIANPFQWTEDGDLLLQVDHDVIEQSINLILFFAFRAFLMQPTFGSDFLMMVFDPLDQLSQIQMDTAIRKALTAQEPRIVLAKSLVFKDNPEDSERIILVPHVVKVTGAQAQTEVVVPTDA